VVKRQEFDYSPPSIADVMNEWSYTSTPPICLHGFYMNFTFTFRFVVPMAMTVNILWCNIL
jgi:hypothetical protein